MERYREGRRERRREKERREKRERHVWGWGDRGRQKPRRKLPFLLEPDVEVIYHHCIACYWSNPVTIDRWFHSVWVPGGRDNLGLPWRLAIADMNYFLAAKLLRDFPWVTIFLSFSFLTASPTDHSRMWRSYEMMDAKALCKYEIAFTPEGQLRNCVLFSVIKGKKTKSVGEWGMEKNGEKEGTSEGKHLLYQQGPEVTLFLFFLLVNS